MINTDITRVVAHLVTIQPGETLPVDGIGNFPALAAQLILNARGMTLTTDHRGRLIVEQLPDGVTPISRTARGEQ